MPTQHAKQSDHRSIKYREFSENGFNFLEISYIIQKEDFFLDFLKTETLHGHGHVHMTGVLELLSCPISSKRSKIPTAKIHNRTLFFAFLSGSNTM